MRVGNARVARRALSTAVGTALACAAFGAMASSAMARGDGGRDTYTVNISPASAPAGTSTTFDVALTNTSSPGSQLDSAILVPPRGFTVTAASLPAGAGGSADVFWNIVVLRHLSLSPGSTLDVSVTAIDPSDCPSAGGKQGYDDGGGAVRHWHTFATEGGIWSEELRLQREDSSVTTTVSCAPTGLKFVAQPSNSTVNQSVAPSVTVETVDGSGNLVSSSAPVTLVLGNNPGGGTLAGTLTEPAVNGVATFSDLSINEPGFGYTLAASSTGLTGATSNPFSETNTTTTTCTTNPCTTDLGTAVSDLSISADPAAGTLNESVDVGTPLSCADAAHGGYAGFDTNWYTFSETGTVNKTLRYELFGLTTDQESAVRMCFGATYDFPTFGGGEAASGTLPDGTPGFIGLLPTCNPDRPVPPCVNSIAPFTDGHSGLLATVTVPGLSPTGAPGDPMIHG
jgi:hypothetical protein